MSAVARAWSGRGVGTPGHIQVTEATYELLKDEFELVPRGAVPIKGKGDMQTWYLVGRRSVQPIGAQSELAQPVAVAGAVSR